MLFFTPKEIPWVLLLLGFLNTIHEGAPMASIFLLLSGAAWLWFLYLRKKPPRR